MRSGIANVGALLIFAILHRYSSAQSAGAFAENHQKGEFYIKNHEVASAISFLRRAYDVDPKNADNAYDLALAYLEQGLLNESRAVLTASLAVHDKAEFHNLLGELNDKEGNITAAAEQYRTAAQLDPSEKNLFDLGSHLLRYRGFDAARTVFSYAVGRYPKSAQLIVGLGITNYSMGNYEQAIDQLCRAVNLDPTDTRALQFLGKMYDVAPDKAPEVTAHLARFAHDYPNDAAANYYYALSLRRRMDGQPQPGRDNQAEQLLERAVKLNPGFVEAHFELGLLYDDEKQDAKAIREYLAAIHLQPEPSKFHYRLSRVYQRDGNSQLAAAESRKFQELKMREDSGKAQ